MARKGKYYQREDGLYEVSRTINGKRVRFRGKTCREVDQKILAYREEQAKGRMVEAVVNEWLTMREAELSASANIVYRYAADRLIVAMRGKRVSDVKPIDCVRHMDSLKRKGYARGTLTIDMAVMNGVFAYAVLSGDVDINPAAEVSLPSNLPSKTRHALTVEQEQKVIACRSGEWWLLGLMLLYTGCRRGELLALDWQDIDRQNGVIHITKKLNYSAGNHPALERHLKNGISRDIPLLDALEDILPRGRVGKIFHNSAGGYISASQFNTLWRDYCTDTGLLDADGKPSVTPHCFRHSMATMCYESGLDSRATAAILGDTEKTTEDIYIELRKRHELTQVERLNAYLAMRQEDAAAEN